MARTKPIDRDAGNKIVAQFLSLPEGVSLDFKRVGRVQNVVKTACAMANTQGGLIILGIEDSQKAKGTERAYGLEEKPECLGETKRAFLHRLTPPLRSPDCDVVVHEIRCTLRNRCNASDGIGHFLGLG